MKTFLISIFLLAGISLSQAQTLKTANDSLAYALGQDLAGYLKRMDLPVNSQILTNAFKDVLDGKKMLFDDTKKEEVIQRGMQRVSEEKQAKLKKAGTDFLLQNKKVAGVKETADGIQYQVITEGKGLQPTLTDTVVIHYKGSLIDGTTFDSSYDRGEPITIQLEDMIEGWKKGVPLMKAGSKYKFFIPYQFGYGERASGPIPAFSSLIFEIELLEVRKEPLNEVKQAL